MKLLRMVQYSFTHLCTPPRSRTVSECVTKWNEGKEEHSPPVPAAALSNSPGSFPWLACAVLTAHSGKPRPLSLACAVLTAHSGTPRFLSLAGLCCPHCSLWHAPVPFLGWPVLSSLLTLARPGSFPWLALKELLVSTSVKLHDQSSAMEDTVHCRCVRCGDGSPGF
ncbi:hypothetical protein O3P69_006635 [Scylla paramamosain]|uniref:Uncharacterized protein n=1 Tax=Scylla paramamosain TaxID=85552 RepID=A0AAW0U1L5_SCYPA